MAFKQGDVVLLQYSLGTFPYLRRIAEDQIEGTELVRTCALDSVSAGSTEVVRNLINLCEINQSFGSLDNKVKMALMCAWVEGCTVQVYDSYTEMWEYAKDPQWNAHLKYRVKRRDPKPDTVDWSQISGEWKYMARDMDGKVYFFQSKPVRNDVWTCRGGSATRCYLTSYKQGEVSWKDSLVERE